MGNHIWLTSGEGRIGCVTIWPKAQREIARCEGAQQTFEMVLLYNSLHLGKKIFMADRKKILKRLPINVRVSNAISKGTWLNHRAVKDSKNTCIHVKSQFSTKLGLIVLITERFQLEDGLKRHVMNGKAY